MYNETRGETPLQVGRTDLNFLDMNKTTIEQQVANAVLQRDVAEIVIDGNTYRIASPTLGTLIAVSDLVSTLPIVENVPKDKIVTSVLRNARHFKKLGLIASTLILGAKPIYVQREAESRSKSLFWGFMRKKKVEVNLQEELAQTIIDNVSPSALFDIIVQRLRDMEIGSFFSITTSLSEANILKPTREVD